MQAHRIVRTTGPVETNEDERKACESCAMDCHTYAPASNGGVLCGFCAEESERHGFVYLWESPFMRSLRQSPKVA